MGSYKYKGNTNTYHSLSDNFDSITSSFEYKDGFFGKEGKAKSNKKKNYRQINSKDPIKTAREFYEKIAKGGTEEPLSNGKGVKTELKDKTIIVYREITSTPNSPAVEINIKRSTINAKIKSQKIHFEKE